MLPLLRLLAHSGVGVSFKVLTLEVFISGRDRKHISRYCQFIGGVFSIARLHDWQYVAHKNKIPIIFFFTYKRARIDLFFGAD